MLIKNYFHCINRYKFHRILFIFLQHILSILTNGKDFVMVGYSFGSLIATEITRRLEAMNFKGRLILIDGAPELLRRIYKYYMPKSELDLQIYVLTNIMEIYSPGSSEKV